jgi:pimeloyl-ACP methyl ester carboxylesterase
MFPVRYAERLAATIPGARLQRIADSRAFVPEDQPERLAQMIAAFVRETGTQQAGVRAHEAM